ncbi:toxin glutamine deamidase domain-containing protein [Planotetraspora sp. A-T 1434]|uniref:toxin glutamine deamidase domain-containing protein n=1 Tax=Planotetraspora sp. A-T 1434 TaxID=2979219 RepID=UPI0021BF67D5|nr:toxin glutamine deamidase domain-containing protein [Planotetraspora sp. A-T 1434]MCT9929142.1 toxin glutamine deamidase domain-containing protein [Planotetraspora sp. A-T 1434]
MYNPVVSADGRRWRDYELAAEAPAPVAEDRCQETRFTDPPKVTGGFNGLPGGVADGSRHGLPNGVANAVADGMAKGPSDAPANGLADGVANGSANSSLNGVANGSANSSLNGSAKGSAAGSANGVVNGSANGGANGSANGSANGVANGVANGLANGALNGLGNGAAKGLGGGVVNGAVNGAAKGPVAGAPGGVADKASAGVVAGAAGTSANDGEGDAEPEAEEDGERDWFDSSRRPPRLEQTRPYGRPGGLAQPGPEAEEGPARESLAQAVNGRFPDPRGTWIRLINAEGPTEDPFRSTNAVDCALAVMSTWHGEPVVAARRQPEYDAGGKPLLTGETGGVARAEQWLGHRFEYVGHGRRAYVAIAQRLVFGGHGAAAMLITRWPGGGSHAWNAVNCRGEVLWIDAQRGHMAVEPPYEDVTGVFCVVTDREGQRL